MNIFDNPFYILGAAPQDNRHKIAALADEKAFISDAERVAEARSVLTTPSRRVNAEIRWFPTLNAEETVELTNYCAALKQGENAEEPEMTMTSSLATLNMKLYAFPLKAFTDFLQIKYAVLEISRLYANLDANILCEEINQDRMASGFPMISDAVEIEDEMSLYRAEIRKDISSRLTEMPQQEYVELITLLSEKYSAPNDRYYGHAVLEDIITEYELHMTPEIERQKQQIIEMASFIKKGAEKIRISDAINDLIQMVTAWDILAQPLQLVARGRGQTQEASEEVAHEVRDLAVTLHNDFGETNEAIHLTEALKQSFSELSDFSERIGEDVSTLHRLKQEKEEIQDTRDSRKSLTDKSKPQWKKSKLICVLIYCILFYTSCYFMVPHGWKLLFVIGFCFCGFAIPWIPFFAEEKIKSKVILTLIKALFCAPIILFIIYLVKFNLIANNNYFISDSSGIQYKISADWELVDNKYVGDDFTHFIYCESKEERIKYNTCYTASYGDVIDLSPRIREQDEYDDDEFGIENIAFQITKDFGKEQSITKDIKLVAETELNYDGEEFIDSGGYFKPEDYGSATWKCTITIKRLFDFWEVLCANIDSSFGESSTPITSTPKPSSTYTAPATTTKPQTSSSPSNTQTKQQKLDALEAKLNALEKEIGDMEDELTVLSDDIDFYESKYYETNSNTYADQYNDAVDAYNAIWEDYDQAIDDYNDMVNEYNSLLN